ncbi:hypothetical protein K1X13_08980 [Nocardioides sp. WL0053]|uniref:Uncharacterized protein n=1 Tax=Nocardioides jiangsuensis TaxID=2866161 RepID=A0ABS7RKF0_9ACTN|nr:hypothetical protein [Nocardioides jiangsuensis]MBY9074949.1 hypothetical protein [Nocardioides jiangsuensis]
MPERAAMLRAVVLADHSGDRVEQVGDPEQPAVPVVDLLVDQRCGQAGVEHPEQSQPGLVRRPAVLARQGERPAYLPHACPGGPLRDVRPHLRDRHQLGRGHHVHRDDRLAHVADPAHLVEQRPACGCAPDAEPRDDLCPEQALAGDRASRSRCELTAGPEDEGDREPRGAVGGEPVEERSAVQPAGRPAGDRAVAWQPGGLLEDPLFGHGRVDVRRHVEAVRRLPPPRPTSAPTRGAREAARVDGDGVDEAARRRADGIPPVP